MSKLRSIIISSTFNLSFVDYYSAHKSDNQRLFCHSLLTSFLAVVKFQPHLISPLTGYWLTNCLIGLAYDQYYCNFRPGRLRLHWLGEVRA